MILRETLPLAFAQLAAPSNRRPSLRVSARLRTVRFRRELSSPTSERKWLLEFEVEVPAIDPERLLAECEDFLVDGRDGREIGLVERVEKAGPGEPISALLVTAGWFGRRRLRVDTDAIEALIPAERRVIVDESRIASVGGDDLPS